jgi:FlaA1/EpsC-like NDP-sugar epimerase
VRVIADVRDRDTLRRVFARHRPEVVFHAAAHKHVGLMEENPEAAVLNNVIGTRNVVDAVLEYGTPVLVNVSTDKAVRPTSVMGATKRVAELVVRAGAARAGDRQTLVSVRFGNVLGSRGSVVPLFLEQIRSGGPVRITHPDMRRYFMTIPEASQLVLQAGAIAQNGAVYILDMGEPVRIVDLATDLIRLSGLEPGVDVPIEFVGPVQGEKLFEELITDQERDLVTSHEKIVMSRMPDATPNDVDVVVEQLVADALAGDTGSLRERLGLGSKDSIPRMAAAKGPSVPRVAPRYATSTPDVGSDVPR